MEEFDPVDAVKSVFIESIARRIRSQYDSQVHAAAELKIDQAVISKLCGGRTQRFSLAWLITLSDKLGAGIDLKVS